MSRRLATSAHSHACARCQGIYAQPNDTLQGPARDSPLPASLRLPRGCRYWASHMAARAGRMCRQATRLQRDLLPQRHRAARLRIAHAPGAFAAVPPLYCGALADACIIPSTCTMAAPVLPPVSRCGHWGAFAGCSAHSQRPCGPCVGTTTEPPHSLECGSLPLRVMTASMLP